MKWIKKGLIYRPENLSWATNSALQPTPLILDENTIRLYVGLRDDKGRSRVGFVDVDAANPGEIKRVSETPALDVGEPGTFDENGVVPCAAVRCGDEVRLYYAGYQLGHSVRFFVFGGLAISRDGGETFSRYSRAPVCERNDAELLFRVIHTIFEENGVWRVWYGAGDDFELDARGYQLPRYNIRYMESPDGLSFPQTAGKVVLDCAPNEYRTGRPFVVKNNGGYQMFFGGGDRKKNYRLAYAESSDGINWTRNDTQLGIDISASGWDSEMMAYPCVVKASNGATYLFYNGNNYGYEGFGYAVAARER
ncbi:MAG: hypothetical protein M3384_10140 [Acidobacteriota bacterium]|nr:hypothetical protein [Acidobacteriota bacterium]